MKTSQEFQMVEKPLPSSTESLTTAGMHTGFFIGLTFVNLELFTRMHRACMRFERLGIHGIDLLEVMRYTMFREEADELFHARSMWQ
jgi:hypothetical protein